jgi:hypothetical protein
MLPLPTNEAERVNISDQLLLDWLEEFEYRLKSDLLEDSVALGLLPRLLEDLSWSSRIRHNIPSESDHHFPEILLECLQQLYATTQCGDQFSMKGVSAKSSPRSFKSFNSDSSRDTYYTACAGMGGMEIASFPNSQTWVAPSSPCIISRV